MRREIIPGENRVRNALVERLKTRGAAKALAIELGVTHAFISLVKSGERAPSEAMAEALGFRKVKRFEPIGERERPA